MFKNARIKLTAWYLLIIMLISISFSVVIFRILHNEVSRFARNQRTRIERRLQIQPVPIPIEVILPNPNTTTPPYLDVDLIQETEQRLLFLLIGVNCGIFILAGAFGYMLAGKTLHPIEQMIDEQHRFISDASHELRTPLTALKASLEVALRDTHLTLESAKDIMKENVDDINKLQKLSDYLLEETHSHTMQTLTEVTSFLMEETITKAIRHIKPAALKKHLQIEVKLASVPMEGNVTMIQELCTILLDNAVKYSPSKSTVHITLEQKNKMTLLKVMDQGIGIAAKDIPHIFDRFYRADTSRSKTKADGYGLGLAIAKNIVEAHHGTIEVKSIQGKGSIFTIYLPTKQSNA